MSWLNRLRQRLYRRNTVHISEAEARGEKDNAYVFSGWKRAKLEPTTATQVPSDSIRDERDIVIGLDFGTSCTKVVVQDAALRAAYAVDFGEYGYRPSPYLVPTQLRLSNGGSFSLTQGSLVAEHLKINLMENADNECEVALGNGSNDRLTYLELATAYIALILQLTRGWFLSNHGRQYKKNRLVWQVNIGIPSTSYDDAALLRTFRLAALAGWHASVGSNAINVDDVKQAYQTATAILDRENSDETPADHTMHPDSCQAVPEVIGEIEGYAKSPMRRECTHLLVDIGATTLDVAGFNLHQYPKHTDRFSILAAEVEKLGVYELHKYRLASLGGDDTGLNNSIADLDEMSHLPSLNAYGGDTIVDQLKDADQAFASRVVRLLCQVIVYTKTKRNPNADIWHEGLPVFICGGGSQVDLYRRAVEDAQKALSSNYSLAPFAILNIPHPDNLKSTKRQVDYHRLAVAYGLSFPFYDLGEIMPPSACSDVSDYRKSYDGADYIGKDQM